MAPDMMSAKETSPAKSVGREEALCVRSFMRLRALSLRVSPCLCIIRACLSPPEFLARLLLP
jgi:hypothetical protein